MKISMASCSPTRTWNFSLRFPRKTISRIFSSFEKRTNKLKKPPSLEWLRNYKCSLIAFYSFTKFSAEIIQSWVFETGLHSSAINISKPKPHWRQFFFCNFLCGSFEFFVFQLLSVFSRLSPGISRSLTRVATSSCLSRGQDKHPKSVDWITLIIDSKVIPFMRKKKTLRRWLALCAILGFVPNWQFEIREEKKILLMATPFFVNDMRV